MMVEWKNARQQLLDGDYTCVLCKGAETVASKQRGVKPLVQWYEENKDYSGFYAADKVVGRGAAFLYALLGVKAVYAGILSRQALNVLSAEGIEVEYGELVENIINRQGNGICPFESAVLNIADKQEAYSAIRKKMLELNISL